MNNAFPDKQRPKSLILFKQALFAGFYIDPVKGVAYRPDGSEWRPHFNSHGYLALQLKIAGQQLHIPLHKAVAYILWGDAAFGGPSVHVRHLDGNKLNCRGENLALGTARDNALDKPESQRSLAAKKRALTLGGERLSEITTRSSVTRGRDAAVRYGRMSGAARKKLTPDQVAMVRQNALKPSGERIKQRDLAATLGVKQGTICDILAGRCYGDIGIEAGLGEHREGV